jgi:hypothetical protein
MSRPRLLRPMSPDLALLGDQLEAAVHRDQRRRARRQLFLNAAASLAVAIPLAIGIATSELGATGQEIGAAGASASLNWTPGYDISVRHITDPPIQTLEWAKCLDGRDCRIYVEPAPFAVDFPPRRA